MDLLSVSDVARRFGIRPREISDLFYQRLLPEQLRVMVGGRSLIPASSLAAIEQVLREHNLIRDIKP